MTAISMLINGERVQAAGGATFERRNPLDGSVATTAPAASVADAKAAADAAAKAFPAWSDLGPNARRALLLKAARTGGPHGRLCGGHGGRDRCIRHVGWL